MDAVELLKALADETRLRLIHLGLHLELNVNEIADTLKMTQPRISKHLGILSRCGLLKSRKQGNWIFYTAAAEGEKSDFIKTLKPLIGKEDIFRADLNEAQTIIENRNKETTRFFDAIAEDWNQLKREIIGDFPLHEAIVAELSPVPVLVDLGCGNGDLLPCLAKLASQVIGVERSVKMLAEARKNLESAAFSYDLRIGEIEHLPMRDLEANSAVINMVLHHLIAPQQTLHEINRVLKKDGELIISDLLSHHREEMRQRFQDRWLGFDAEIIQKWLKESGFSLKSWKTFSLKNNLSGFIAAAKKQ